MCTEEDESSLGSHDDTEHHTDEGPEEAMPFLINNAVLGWKLSTPRSDAQPCLVPCVIRGGLCDERGSSIGSSLTLSLLSISVFIAC